MDKNTAIGLTLIFLLFFAWQYFTAPSPAELQARKRTQDSLALVEKRKNDALAENTPVAEARESLPRVPDSVQALQLAGKLGPFAPAGIGEEQEFVLENDKVRLTFTNKGARVKAALLKEYAKMTRNRKRKDVREPLYLLDEAENRFEYFIPVASLGSGGVRTGDLFFKGLRNGNEIVFRAEVGEGQYFEQKYALKPGAYTLDYSVRLNGLDGVVSANTEAIALTWENALGKIEKATRYERTYATVYFRPQDGRVKRCSPTKNEDTKNADGQAVKWVANTNQFFNSSLIASTSFTSLDASIKSLPEAARNMKIATSKIGLPIKEMQDKDFNMQLYIGPNDFEQLRALGYSLEEIIPFGQGILGSINRWVVRPMFSWLSSYFVSAGLTIFMLTLIVKLLLFPLSYRMLYSQSKMTVLKPEMEKLKEKFKDDPQRQQMETMSVYREFGVNPLGSCMPMLLQMPVWIALYRFFPAAIEFRQKGFWWAPDLSSYDEFLQLPFTIPFGFGDHISLFTLLWVLTTLIYTWYNSRHMDFSANPALKYMQYIMPVMFMGFFNGYASGLTAYLLFSNVINIGQTLVTKHFIIDEEKIKREMEAFRKKPKSKTGFSARLESALKEQQRVAAQRDAAKKKK
jgi:YidC/Oxa1 family membrane protein insertase